MVLLGQLFKLATNVVPKSNLLRFAVNGSKFLGKNEAAIGALDKIATVAGLGCAGLSVFNGQEKGSIGDLFSGFLDLAPDQYHSNGGTETGSTFKETGKLLQNFALMGLTFIPKGKLAAKFGANGMKVVNRIYMGLAVHQLTTVGSNFIAPDDSGMIENTANTVSGGASALKLLSLLRLKA